MKGKSSHDLLNDDTLSSVPAVAADSSSDDEHEPNHTVKVKLLILRSVPYLNKLCGRPPQYAPAPCKLTFDLLTLKVVSESRVTRATSVPILVFLGLSVLELGLMYATDVRRASLLNAPCPRGGGIIMLWKCTVILCRHRCINGCCQKTRPSLTNRATHLCRMQWHS